MYWNLVRNFLTIGSLSFGGYMSLISMIRERLIVKDKLISDHTLTEAISIASLLPGPVAVNVVAFICYRLAGVLGAIMGVISVLLPSFVLMLVLSVLYYNYNSVLRFDFILIGVIPVVISLIFSTGFSMWKVNCRSLHQILVALTSILLMIFWASYWMILGLITAAGILGIWFNKDLSGPLDIANVRLNLRTPIGIVSLVILIYSVGEIWLKGNLLYFIFGKFSSISLTLFGGGYVMIPVLKSLLVDQTQLIKPDDFILGISMGQITPGPIMVSSVFFGYGIKSFPGAIMATFGMFLPTSLLMILVSHFYQIVNSSSLVHRIVNGIKPAVVGLIIYSGISLIISFASHLNLLYLTLLVVFYFISLIKYKFNPMLLIILSAITSYFICSLMSL